MKLADSRRFSFRNPLRFIPCSHLSADLVGRKYSFLFDKLIELFRPQTSLVAKSQTPPLPPIRKTVYFCNFEWNLRGHKSTKVEGFGSASNEEKAFRYAAINLMNSLILQGCGDSSAKKESQILLQKMRFLPTRNRPAEEYVLFRNAYPFWDFVFQLSSLQLFKEKLASFATFSKMWKLSPRELMFLLNYCWKRPGVAHETIPYLGSLSSLDGKLRRSGKTLFVDELDGPYLKRGLLSIEYERCLQILQGIQSFDLTDAVKLLGIFPLNSASSRYFHFEIQDAFTIIQRGDQFLLRKADEELSELAETAQRLHGNGFDYSHLQSSASSDDLLTPKSIETHEITANNSENAVFPLHRRANKAEISAQMQIRCLACSCLFNVTKSKLSSSSSSSSSSIKCPNCGNFSQSNSSLTLEDISPIRKEDESSSYRFARPVHEGVWILSVVDAKTSITGERLITCEVSEIRHFNFIGPELPHIKRPNIANSVGGDEKELEEEAEKVEEVGNRQNEEDEDKKRLKNAKEGEKKLLKVDEAPLTGRASYWAVNLGIVTPVYERQVKALHRMSDSLSLACDESLRACIVRNNSAKTLKQLNDAISSEKTHKKDLVKAHLQRFSGAALLAYNNLGNAQRRSIIGSIVGSLPFYLIQGPPGTGKTLIAALIVVLWATDASVTSPIFVGTGTHAAAYTLLSTIRSFGLRADPVGTPEDVCIRYKAHLNSKDKVFKALHDEDEGKPAQKARIFVDTVYQAQKLRASMNLERVIIDESSQLTEFSAIIAVARGCKKLVLIGDPKQLPPISRIPEHLRSNYGALSMFENMNLSGIPENRFFLNVQFRMPELLCEFPSKEFYGGLLQTSAMLKAKDINLPAEFPWAFAVGSSSPLPLLFLDLNYQFQGSSAAHFSQGAYSSPFAIEGDLPQYAQLYGEEIFSSSYQNPLEARLTCAVVKHLIRAGVQKERITIITPYSSHRMLLKQLLYQEDSSKGFRKGSPSGSSGFIRSAISFFDAEPHPRVSTVDSFQGCENDYMIFSAVRSNRNSSVGFLGDPHRLNVVLTRAKKALIVIGDGKTLSSNPLWRRWISHTESLGARRKIFYR